MTVRRPATRAWLRHIKQRRIPLGGLATHQRKAQALCTAALREGIELKGGQR